jgi:glycosyltransferase involved in cell wall biosynthesis
MNTVIHQAQESPRVACMPPFEIPEWKRAASISACIVCRNEADKLPPCLESVRWADEILVMDLSSVDNSADVAKAYGARVISREPHPIVEPLRNELASFARGAWILALDPDERVSPRLAVQLRELAQRTDLDAIVIPRMNYDLSYPPSNRIQRYEPQLRMYRHDRVRWPEIPNQLPIVAEERKCRIANEDALVLVHDRNRNVPEALERTMRYAPAQAQSMLDQGQVFSARDMFSALAAQTEKEFIRAEAWSDGVPGMLRATLLVMYKFCVWTAFWQLSGAKRTREDDQFVQRIGKIIQAIYFMMRVLGKPYRIVRSVFHA